jgi:hypothetical protein
MYCPNCGKTNSREQKFCRSCGLSLEKVVQSLIEQLPAADIDRKLRERRRKVELWATILATGGISAFVLAVLWGIIYKMIIVEGHVAGGLVFLAVIVAIIGSALLMLYRESLAKASKRPSLEPESSPPADTAKLLPEPSYEPIASVTESTTELLPVERKERGR